MAVDLAVLVGLAGVAVTGPVMDLFGRNPTFFVAGGYGRHQIVAFALVVAFVPALVAFVGSAVPGLVDRRVGASLHSGAVAGFAGLFGLVVCQSGAWTAWFRRWQWPSWWLWEWRRRSGAGGGRGSCSRTSRWGTSCSSDCSW